MRLFIAMFVCLGVGCGSPSVPPADEDPDAAHLDTPAADVRLEDVTDDAMASPDAGTDSDSLIVDAEQDLDAGFDAGFTGRAPERVETEVFVAAHADDDLLFMNPDILEALRAGRAVRTIVVTAGDACGNRDPEEREAGLRAAYGLMTTGEADSELGWTCGAANLGVPARVCALDTTPHVSLVFLRAPDCAPALLELVDGSRDTLDSVADSSVALTRRALLRAISGELQALNVATVHTLEATGVYGHDNADHIATARLTYAAAAVAEVERYREHRTYNVDGEPLNLHPDDLEPTWEAMHAYCEVANEEDGLCVAESGVAYWEWARRQYPVQRLERYRGRLQNDGQCLIREGRGVGVGPCESADAWELRGWALGVGDQCLADNGDLPGIAPCTASVVSLMSNGQLRLEVGDQCLQVGPAGLELAACAGLEEGGPIHSQVWRPAIGPIHQGGPFSDLDLRDSGQRSFQPGVATDPGVTEFCIRATAGLTCAGFDGRRWQSPRVLAAEFSDASDWWSLLRDMTIRVLDFNGDGLLDACGRGRLGLLCGAGEGEVVGGLRVFSDDPYFADETGTFWFEAAYARSLGFAWLGAEWPHLCVRTLAGVSCSPPTEDGSWGPIVDVLQTEFSDMLGWDGPAYGATIRYGDIDGDSLTDVCGRSSIGLVCALGTNDGRFQTPRFWGFRDQLSDAADWPRYERYSGALELVDLNLDGRADACLRSPDGLVCGWSTGTTFDSMLLVGGFTDEDGFENARHGGQIVWDVPSRHVCARHSDGVWCGEL